MGWVRLINEMKNPLLRVILMTGIYSAMVYQILGQGDTETYDPAAIMERFLNGGDIPEREGVTTDA